MAVTWMRKKYKVGKDYTKNKSSSANQGTKKHKAAFTQTHKKQDPPMLHMDAKTGRTYFVPAEN